MRWWLLLLPPPPSIQMVFILTKQRPTNKSGECTLHTIEMKHRYRFTTFTATYAILYTAYHIHIGLSLFQLKIKTWNKNKVKGLQKDIHVFELERVKEKERKSLYHKSVTFHVTIFCYKKKAMCAIARGDMHVSLSSLQSKCIRTQTIN